MTLPICFLSDYGHDDDFVGVCHGVMARIAPAARVIDVSHGVPRHDVRSGALILRRALPYCPAGIHLAVVDPEVGGDRAAIALRTADDDRILVGPDNGLLSLAAQRFGGAIEAVDIGNSPFRLEPTSKTFHGRDLFAPVAARLAAGAPLAAAGDPIDPDEITQIHMPLATFDGDQLVAHAIGFDRYGNVTLDVEHDEIAGFGMKIGHQADVGEHSVVYATTFADVPRGAPLLYEDAYRTLSLAVNRGSAAELFGLQLDAEIRIRVG